MKVVDDALRTNGEEGFVEPDIAREGVERRHMIQVSEVMAEERAVVPAEREGRLELRTDRQRRNRRGVTTTDPKMP